METVNRRSGDTGRGVYLFVFTCTELTKGSPKCFAVINTSNPHNNPIVGHDSYCTHCTLRSREIK